MKTSSRLEGGSKVSTTREFIVAPRQCVGIDEPSSHLRCQLPRLALLPLRVGLFEGESGTERGRPSEGLTFGLSKLSCKASNKQSDRNLFLLKDFTCLSVNELC